MVATRVSKSLDVEVPVQSALTILSGAGSAFGDLKTSSRKSVRAKLVSVRPASGELLLESGCLGCYDCPSEFTVGVGDVALSVRGLLRKVAGGFCTLRIVEVSSRERRQGDRRVTFSAYKPLPLFLFTKRAVYPGRGVDLGLGGIRVAYSGEVPSSFKGANVGFAPDGQKPLRLAVDPLGWVGKEQRFQFHPLGIEERGRLERFISSYVPF